MTQIEDLVVETSTPGGFYDTNQGFGRKDSKGQFL